MATLPRRVVLFRPPGNAADWSNCAPPGLQHNQLAFRITKLVEQLAGPKGDSPFCIKICNHAEEAEEEDAESSSNEFSVNDLNTKVIQLEQAVMKLQREGRDQEVDNEQCRQDREDLRARITQLAADISANYNRLAAHTKADAHSEEP